MPGILGTRAPLIADLVLVTEAVVALLLIFGYLNIRRGRVALHRRSMTLATLTQIGAVVFLMIPASQSYRPLYPDPGVTSFLRVYMPLHMVGGIALLGLATFLVYVMANYPKPRRWRPARFKLLMQPLLVAWLVTMLGGVVFSYALKYLL